jgi:amyloid beta A4 precursor protein-binding family B protein 1-interacting protein
LLVQVFTSDGSAKSLLVDEKMNVGQVTRLLAEKNHVQLDPKWSLVELVPDLYMERVYEDHEQLVENLLLWKVNVVNDPIKQGDYWFPNFTSCNTILFF